MDRKLLTRILAGVMAALLLLGLLPLAASAEAMTFVMEVSSMDSKPKGTWKNGDAFKCGTDNYFTVFCSETTRIDESEKEFADGYTATKRLNFNSNTVFGDQILNAVQIKTTSAAKVKVWFVSGGDDREVAIFDQQGNALQQSGSGAKKNLTYIAEFDLAEPNTYYIANIGGNNNYVKIEVTEENPVAPEPMADWATVAAPQITAVADDGQGNMTVTVKAVVGRQGGDELVVTMVDTNGKTLDTCRTILEKGEHTLLFNPEVSGEYTFRAVLNRSGEEGKPAAQDKVAAFTLPLAAPTLSSATSKGNGTVEVVFTPSLEAEKYEIFCDGASVGATTETTFTAEGLTVGQKYSFYVEAVRGQTRSKSGTLEVTATQDAKVAWGYTHYGPSTNEENNGFAGDLNEDGFVTVYSENGRGKIVPASVDGLSFYYTAVSTEYNFTLRAKILVDSWSYSNGQEGFGIMACDRLGVSGDSGNFWNNQVMAVATKIEYRYESVEVNGEETDRINNVDGAGTKYTMKLGLGTIVKTGVKRSTLSMFEGNLTSFINENFVSQVDSLECSAGHWGKDGGTYNIIGNYTGEVEPGVEKGMLTEMDLEIQKNNTGYFVTYYAPDGTIAYQRKFYGADMLNMIDEDYVYVGFFAARNARITVKDVRFSSILAAEDAPAEEKPKTVIQPTAVAMSPTVTTSPSYDLWLDANVDGTVEVMMNSTIQAVKDFQVEGGKRAIIPVELPAYGDTRIVITFRPDADQDLGPDTILENADPIYVELLVDCNKPMSHRKTIYVGPDGLPNGDGTRENPFDIQTAVNQVVAGQTIVLLEGTYKLSSTLRIQRGMDGTEEAPIRMIADPNAATRPVLDFQGESSGIVHGGDYWYFAGFDVTNSQDTQKGFQVSGNYNTLDRIHAYRNGSTGIQISRYSGADLYDAWPCYNLILNCESYYNADPGEEDADGFAAKLTCGPGNVFDGCVAHHNADDGWDLYAKVETGSIGAVTIRNCVAYANGIREDGTVGTGNGNGFKLGGESLSGKHVLENSFAWGNKSKGIDSNSCPDIIVRNCVAYNNGTYNVALYTNNAADTAFEVTGVISLKDSSSVFADSLSQGDNLKPKGSQNESKYTGEGNYYWNGSTSLNSKGAAFTADQFASVSFTEILRNADGTLNMQGYLQAAGLGITMGGTASGDMTTLPADEACTYDGTWFVEDSLFHWQECQCGNRGHYGEHQLKWIVDQEPTQEVAGKKHRQCKVCGYNGPVMDMQYGEVLEEDVPADAQQSQPKPGNTGLIAGIVLAVAAVVGGGALVLGKKKKKQ